MAAVTRQVGFNLGAVILPLQFLTGYFQRSMEAAA